MSDKIEVEVKCPSIDPTPPTNFGDGSSLRGYVSNKEMCTIGSVREAINRPAPRVFTWEDARAIANFVRDGLLMIVKGLERVFDLGKK